VEIEPETLEEPLHGSSEWSGTRHGVGAAVESELAEHLLPDDSLCEQRAESVAD
jgi:hypothetical protein